MSSLECNHFDSCSVMTDLFCFFWGQNKFKFLLFTFYSSLNAKWKWPKYDVKFSTSFQIYISLHKTLNCFSYHQDKITSFTLFSASSNEDCRFLKSLIDFMILFLCPIGSMFRILVNSTSQISSTRLTDPDWLVRVTWLEYCSLIG